MTAPIDSGIQRQDTGINKDRVFPYPGLIDSGFRLQDTGINKVRDFPVNNPELARGVAALGAINEAPLGSLHLAPGLAEGVQQLKKELAKSDTHAPDQRPTQSTGMEPLNFRLALPASAFDSR